MVDVNADNEDEDALAVMTDVNEDDRILTPAVWDLPCECDWCD